MRSRGIRAASAGVRRVRSTGIRIARSGRRVIRSAGRRVIRSAGHRRRRSPAGRVARAGVRRTVRSRARRRRAVRTRSGRPVSDAAAVRPARSGRASSARVPVRRASAAAGARAGRRSAGATVRRATSADRSAAGATPGSDARMRIRIGRIGGRVTGGALVPRGGENHAVSDDENDRRDREDERVASDERARASEEALLLDLFGALRRALFRGRPLGFRVRSLRFLGSTRFRGSGGRGRLRGIRRGLRFLFHDVSVVPTSTYGCRGSGRPERSSPKRTDCQVRYVSRSAIRHHRPRSERIR